MRFSKDKTPYKTHQGAFVVASRPPAGMCRSREQACARVRASMKQPESTGGAEGRDRQRAHRD
ncbi:MAG: DUF2461 family protein [Marmoricola sp.]